MHGQGGRNAPGRAVSRPEVATTVLAPTRGNPPQAALQQAGITAAELARRVPRRKGVDRLSADALEAWLVDAGLAELHDGRLTPTARAIEVAGALA